MKNISPNFSLIITLFYELYIKHKLDPFANIQFFISVYVINRKQKLIFLKCYFYFAKSFPFHLYCRTRNIRYSHT